MEMARKTSKLGGFTAIEIVIAVVLVGIIALLVAAEGPIYVGRGTSKANSCIANLRIIDGAKEQWAFELHKQPTDTPTSKDLQPCLGRSPDRKLPCCPDDPKQTFDTSYSINNMVAGPSCKISPTNHILP